MKKAFLLDVQKIEDERFSGNIHDLCEDERYSFVGVERAFLLMDQAMVQEEGLEKTQDMRYPAPIYLKEAARFYVRVLFRERNTWQGEVTRIKTGEKKRFRSTLELLHMIDQWYLSR